MKQLENVITLEGGHTATLVKRNGKAAIYKRETAEGTFVSFEVFAIMVKDGMEIYPNKNAVTVGWCFCPIAEDRANVWFDRFTNGEVAIPQVDPVTGEAIESDNRTLDELPDVETPIVEETPVTQDTYVLTAPEEPPVIVPVVDIPAGDPTTPETPVVAVEVPVVDVPKAEPKKRGRKAGPSALTMVIPEGEFDQATFARANGLPERGVVWSRLDDLVKAGKIVKRFGNAEKPGRPKAFFTAAVTVTDAPAVVVDVPVAA